MNNIILREGIYMLDSAVTDRVVWLEKAYKSIAEEKKALEQAILEEMEEKNIVKVDSPRLSVTYIAETDRETFDKKLFQKEHGDLYDEYVKMTPVKSSIRVKVK